MTVVNANLVKRQTEDGLVTVRDNVPLGKVYLVLPETRRTWTTLNLPTRRVVRREMILDADSREWLPTELLDIEDGGVPCPT